jgi:hypothetical protein
VPEVDDISGDSGDVIDRLVNKMVVRPLAQSERHVVPVPPSHPMRRRPSAPVRPSAGTSMPNPHPAAVPRNMVDARRCSALR